MIDPAAVVAIDYTNYRGERAIRRILPLRMRFAATEWHPERQWLLTAIDVEKDAERDFAMRDVHSWAPADTDPPRWEDYVDENGYA